MIEDFDDTPTPVHAVAGDSWLHDVLDVFQVTEPGEFFDDDPHEEFRCPTPKRSSETLSESSASGDPIAVSSTSPTTFSRPGSPSPGRPSDTASPSVRSGGGIANAFPSSYADIRAAANPLRPRGQKKKPKAPKEFFGQPLEADDEPIVTGKYAVDVDRKGMKKRG